MNSSDAIGGFFGLELPPVNGSNPHLNSKAVALNTGRNCLGHILKANKTKHLYIPKYVCDAVLEPLRQQKIAYSFYKINDRLELAEEVQLERGEQLLYVNYFGVKDSYCEELLSLYGDKVVLDCTQAYYYIPSKPANAFYSARKFFGVPDGGYAYSPAKGSNNYKRGISYERSNHLLKRLDVGPEKSYEGYKNNEISLSGQPITRMSNLTAKLLASIDMTAVKRRRKENFRYLHGILKDRNLLDIDTSFHCPMTYPFIQQDTSMKSKLISNRIYIPTYWPNVLEWAQKDELEHHLALNILPLPIDQRYSKAVLDRVLQLVI